MRYLRVRDDEPRRDLLGGKAATLALLDRAGLPVPAWFAVSAAAFAASRPAQGGLPACPHPAVADEIAQALAALCPHGETVAVRSSAQEEDGLRLSYAGQLDSLLFVPPAQVPEAVVRVWHSAFGERVLAYRRGHGLTERPDPPCVLVQRMVEADAAGVAFSADPLSGRHAVALVCAVRGVGAALVDGACDADSYEVDRAGQVLAQRLAARPGTAGETRRPVLAAAQAAAVAELARRCARLLGRPQDIEWAIAGGRLWLLQSRPITTLRAGSDPDGALAIWDDSNIAESYGGVTTPLTFSYIRRNYAHAYRELCRLAGVGSDTLAEHEDSLGRMLGLLRGRVYYNLPSWYRLLALIPAFEANRRFLDQMLGIEAAPPGELLQALGRARPPGPLGRLAAWRSAALLCLHHLTLERRTRRFQQRLASALAEPCPALEDLRADELAAYFRSLDHRLLTHWDAPLANDFFAMVFHGLLRRLVARWFAVGDHGLHNDLLCGEAGMVSVEPALRVRELAALAAAQPGFVERLCHAAPHAIAQQMPPAFAARLQDYLARFGDRCHHELKLESLSLHDDPLPLLRAVGAAARDPRPPEDRGPALRRQAEQRAQAVLGWHPLRQVVFRWVLANARALVRERENLRLARTRAFGRARRVFVEIGKRLHAAGLLDAPRDIFYLELDEVLGFIEGTASCTDLRGLAALRQAEFERHRAAAAPAGRLETRGAVHLAPLAAAAVPAPAIGAQEERQGQGCGPGIARGPVQVIRDAARARPHSGAILVAERTDPGWVMLFPLAAGLVVERGSLLSHAAIVAREMGLPAVVGLGSACQWLHDGDWVEVDGSRGRVRRIAAPTAQDN